jgi:tetratricopeptide (TPR) repeat protein
MKNKFNQTISVFLSVVIVLICNLVVLTDAGHAQQSEPTYIFYKGNTLYEEGKYDEAIHEFAKLLDRGLESGNLYYNIGNCYFKKGKLGKAILNYERAKRLIPRDSDLKSNYKFAISRLEYDIAEKSSWIKRITGLFNFLSLNELTILLSSAFLMAVIFFTFRLFIPGLRKHTLAVTVCLIIAIILLSIPLAQRSTLLYKEAVVISGNPEVRFEPIDNSTVHFTLYEGMKISTIQSKKEWTKVRRADGKVGWIKSGDIEKI